jgi:hypothetical protein
MCVQIDFSNRDPSGRTVSVGGRGGGGLLGQPWRLRVQRVMELINDPRWVFFTADGTSGRRALVTRSGNALTTTPDGTTRNNLDVLPGGNLDLPETEPAFPERPYLRTPELGAVLRGNPAVTALRGGSFPTQPAPNIGVRFNAPWPAGLEVTVAPGKGEGAVRSGDELLEVGFSSGASQPQLDQSDLGWYYAQDVTGLSAGTELQTWTIRVVPPIGLRQSPVRITIRQRTLSSRCMPRPQDGPLLAARLTETYRSSPLRIDTGRTTRHPRLWDYTPAERRELATAIEAFLTPAVQAAHYRLDHSTRVVDDHRLYLSMLEDYLWVNGLGGNYVPLPFWNPTEAIPDEFRTVVSNAAPLQNFNPGIALPDALRAAALCTIQTLPELWDAMRSWHAAVHGGVGGAMRTIQTNAPAALIFWPWHAYVDNIYTEWELCG